MCQKDLKNDQISEFKRFQTNNCPSLFWLESDYATELTNPIPATTKHSDAALITMATTGRILWGEKAAPSKPLTRLIWFVRVWGCVFPHKIPSTSPLSVFARISCYKKCVQRTTQNDILTLTSPLWSLFIPKVVMHITFNERFVNLWRNQTQTAKVS